MTSLRLDSIDNIGHVDVKVRDVDNENDVTHETYTGSIAIGFANDGGSIRRERFETYLPIERGVLREYDQFGFQAAVMVSLGAVQATEDEEFIGSVDGWSIGLRSSSSGGGLQNLVLTFDLGVLNGVIHRVNYNVTVAMTGTFTNLEDVSGSVGP